MDIIKNWSNNFLEDGEESDFLTESCLFQYFKSLRGGTENIILEQREFSKIFRKLLFNKELNVELCRFVSSKRRKGYCFLRMKTDNSGNSGKNQENSNYCNKVSVIRQMALTQAHSEVFDHLPDEDEKDFQSSNCSVLGDSFLSPILTSSDPKIEGPETNQDSMLTDFPFEVCKDTAFCLEDSNICQSNNMESISTDITNTLCSNSNSASDNMSFDLKASTTDIPKEFDEFPFLGRNKIDPADESVQMSSTIKNYMNLDTFGDSEILLDNQSPEQNHNKSQMDGSFHPFFGKVKLKNKNLSSGIEISKSVKMLPYREESKEGPNFNFNIFCSHKDNIRMITPKSLPCRFEKLDDFLQDVFPLSGNNIWQRCKDFSSEYEKKLKCLICAAFSPINIGEKAAAFLGLKPKIGFPQFTLSNPKKVVIQCEACTHYADWNLANLKSQSTKSPLLSGFQQVYQHFISKTHKKALEWLEEPIIEISGDNHEATGQQQNKITRYIDIENKKVSECLYLWEKDIVDSFKNDNAIRRKQAKTIFSEKRLSRKCALTDGHKNCCEFKEWKGKHKQEYKALLELSSSTARSVYVPGEKTVVINGNTVTINGGIKSLDPPCLGTASTVGDYPYTCQNCVNQKPALKNLMYKRSKSKYSTSENRIGKIGFNINYAKKDERSQYLNTAVAKAKKVRQAFCALRNSKLNEKSWLDKLYESCLANDDQKLIIDIMVLLQDSNKAIQIEVLRNLVGKLKSGHNHRFTDIIKDIGVLHKNRLGSTNYSIFKNLFGLPSKTTCNNYVQPSKIVLGINQKQIDFACDIYEGKPVVECSDEARTLRFITPLEREGQVELVGACWDADIEKWQKCTSLLSLEKSDYDQFTALKDYIDQTVSSGNLAKDTAIHNFSCMSGPLKLPLTYLVWPTPNKGYKSYHLLKVWDCIRRHCFLDKDNNLRHNPVMLMGHSTDSAGFQLSAAKALVTPTKRMIEAGIKYLCLGVQESAFAAPYLGPLPAIAYLDYEHEMRLFLKCLKYETLDLTFWKGSCLATINHLKELQTILLRQHNSIPFLASDLLFARYLDQNCDAALRVFTNGVAELLEKHVIGSDGTVLFIRAVVLLMSPFIEPSDNPNDMQLKTSAGITVFRLWRSIIATTKMRVQAAPGAKNDPEKKGHFLTYGCYQTAEILFSAATNHMLAMFAHFKHLGPEVAAPCWSGTKTTERIISEIQGKTTHLQSLDSQPTLADILSRLSMANMNQRIEEELIAKGVSKDSSSSRKKLTHKPINVLTGTFSYPDTYAAFQNSQIISYNKGIELGKMLFSKYCKEGAAFLKKKKLWPDSNSEGFHGEFVIIPSENIFNGSVTREYAENIIKNVNSADVLIPRGSDINENDNFDDVSNGIDDQSNLCSIDTELSLDDADMCDSLGEEGGTHAFADKDVSSSRESSKWFITRINSSGVREQIHIKTAINILLPREYISRERCHRHIASTYLPGLNPIDENHDIILFDFVLLRLSVGVMVGKVISISEDGKSVVSANSQSNQGTVRSILFEQASDYEFTLSVPFKITKYLQFNHVIGKVNVKLKDGKYCLNEIDQSNFDQVLKNEQTVKDFKIAKAIQNSLNPIDYEEVEDIIGRKVNPKTHAFIYKVKFARSEETAWIPATSFLYEVQYQPRRRCIEQNSKNFVINQHSLKRKNVDNEKGPNKRLKLGNKADKKLSVFKVNSNIGGEDSIENDNTIILKEGVWLNDQHIFDAMNVIKNCYPIVKGLQDTLYSEHFSDCGDGSMQIHHNGASHWLFSINFQGTIHIFDSLLDQPNTNLCQQLLRCYASKIENDCLHVIYPHRQKQYGGSACGLFAVAYATEAAVKNNILSETVFFDQSKLREHLFNCLSKKNMTPFPKQQVIPNLLLEKKYVIPTNIAKIKLVWNRAICVHCFDVFFIHKKVEGEYICIKCCFKNLNTSL